MSSLPKPRQLRATNLLFDPLERFTLNAHSPIPLYHQLEKVILDRISTRDDAVGKMLPPEMDLMQMFGVSRATVKKTTDLLTTRGLIRRRRARGTEIISQGLREELARLTSFTEQMELRGLKVSTQTLEATEIAATAAVARKLAIEPHARVLSVRRLRGTSKLFPVVLLHSCIPASFGISSGEDFSGSLYTLLESKYKIPILYADQEISARRATREEARLLRINAGDPVLVMQRVAYTTHDQRIEYVTAVYQSENYTYSIQLRR